MMTEQEERAIRAREANATPGPWRVKRYSQWATPADIRGPDHHGVVCCSSPDANADFVAHAREDIRTLLAALDRVRAELREAKR